MQKKFALKGVINRGIHQGDIYLLIFFSYTRVWSHLKEEIGKTLGLLSCLFILLEMLQLNCYISLAGYVKVGT